MDPALISRLIEFADAKGLPEAPREIGPHGLCMIRSRTPTPLQNALYAPLFCFVLQGRKEAHLGDRVVSYGRGDTMIVSVDLPTTNRVREASPDRPYVGLALRIDFAVLRSLQAEIDLSEPDLRTDHAIASGASGAAPQHAMGRLFDLLSRPAMEQQILTPLLIREVHFHMLMQEHGGMLRRLLQPDSHASRVNRAIVKLRRDYASPVSVNELASLAGMSLSSFHEHFKAVTATTPLQFQKDIRLLVARQKLADEGLSVTTAAFAVGYESPTQFSREFARKFGYPPSREARRGDESQAA